jgi:CheY-like chemotaxis protein
VNRRILVVDDDHAMVRTLRDILELRGWSTHAAHSGEEAVDAATLTDYPWVLMDIRMSGMDGVAASKAMKAASPATQVALMTAHASPEALTEAELAGVRRVFTKPIDMPALLEMLGPS